MKYNLKNPIDKQRCYERFEQLISSDKIIELKEVSTNRTLSQNRYLHLILSWFALEYGERTDYVKQKFFKGINKDIFECEYVNRKTGEVRRDLRSTASLDTKELTVAIDRFRDWSSKEGGIYLPSPNENEYLAQIEVEMSRQVQYV